MEIKTVVLIRASMASYIVKAAEHIDSTLRKYKVRVLHLYGPYDCLHDPHLPDETIDLAFAIGGDGTVLKASRICASRNIPILPVKVGHFGFINEIQCDEWENAFNLYKDGKCLYDKHPLISVSMGDSIWYALNDITIQTALYGTIHMKVYCDDDFLTNYRSDGLVFSTAIGSTAHSLSIGGPIISPTLKVMMINPIAPFTLSHRPLILPLHCVMTLHLEQGQRSTACLIADGRIVHGMIEGASCTIQNSGMIAYILKSPHRSYFEVLRNKLKWSGAL